MNAFGSRSSSSAAPSQANHGITDEFRGVAAVLREMKDEARQFAQTRVNLLKTELQQKIPNLKIAAMLALVGIMLITTAYLLFTFALVALLAVFFRNSDYRWVFSFLSVGLLWSMLAAVALYFAKHEFAIKGLMPKRTFEVLKGDKIWLEKEARSQA